MHQFAAINDSLSNMSAIRIKRQMHHTDTKGTKSAASLQNGIVDDDICHNRCPVTTGI
jgi:hypothetical protein